MAQSSSVSGHAVGVSEWSWSVGFGEYSMDGEWSVVGSNWSVVVAERSVVVCAWSVVGREWSVGGKCVVSVGQCMVIESAYIKMPTSFISRKGFK